MKLFFVVVFLLSQISLADGVAKTYTTKKKESLVEISEMLFGDSQSWKKLWSLNKNIVNPYEIPPGTTITITDATSDSPPSLGFSFNPIGQEKMGTMASPDLLGYTLNVEIPPNSHEKASALDEIPETLPHWRFRKDASTLTKMQLGRVRPNIPESIKNLDFFVTENSTEGLGEVVGTEMNLNAAGEFQYIYVRLNKASNEKFYIVVKDLGEVQSSFVSQKPMMVQIQGSIEVLESVDVSKGIYRALVKKALGNVEVGAKLVMGRLPTYVFTVNDQLSAARATIIGGHFSTSRHLFGTESVVFLDHGKKEGLADGQMLPIYQFQRAKLDNNFVKEHPRLIGKLKVVKTTEHFSTAVIVDSISEIEVGDGTSPDLKKN